MTYEEAREYTKEISKSGSVPGLTNIRCLMEKLSNVQEELSVIHIAGTNGKGSVGTFLSCGLMEAGYRVGRYTSPAVFSPLEVWQMNGEDITIEDYTNILSQVKEACDILVSEGMPQPTVFEVETAVAFLYFYQKKCDYAIVETGMGGTLDATNLITHPVCSVMTSISMDHMQFLGNEITQIAQAKAGIIKKHCPVVTVRQKPKVMEVLRLRADECETELLTAEPDMAKDVVQSEDEISYLYAGSGCIRQEPDLQGIEMLNRDTMKSGYISHEGEVRFKIGMAGGYQIENSLLAAVTLQNVLHIPLPVIASGFKKAVWPGRFEVIKKEPLFVIDGAHNEDAAEKLCQTIQNYFTNRDITYIIGVLADKEYDKMLRKLLPFAKRVYTVTPQNPRALSADLLAVAVRKCLHGPDLRQEKSPNLHCIKSADKQDPFRKCGGKSQIEIGACDSVEEAVQRAFDQSEKADVILAFGSLSYLSEVKAIVTRFWEESGKQHTQGEDRSLWSIKKK